METTVLLPETKTVKYLPYFLTKPKDLISLSKEYKEQVPILLNKKRKHPYGPILYKRIQNDGSILSKILNGFVKDFCDNGFTFVSNETFNVLCEEEQKTFIRTDNVLGWIPFLLSPSAVEMNPYENHICGETEKFFVFLTESKEVFKKCSGETHKATICLRNGGTKKKIIDCKIILVNESNIEIEQYRSVLYENGNCISTTLGKTEKVILFAGPEFYLQKSDVTLGEEHNISPYDGGKCSGEL